MSTAKARIRRLRVEQLNLPQPAIRSGREQLDELVASVEEVGILVPLVVRAIGEDEYAVIAGAGRLEALRRTGGGPKATVPCVVVDVDDAEATLLALVENVVREDMRPFDEAETARVLIEDYGYTQRGLAKALGKSQAGLSKKLAVFRLIDAVTDALRKGEIEMGPALALLPLEGNVRAQKKILTRMKREDLSSAQVKALVARERFGDAAVAPLKYQVDGAGKVEARTTPQGKLRVVMEAEDREALRALWASVSGKLDE